MRKTIISVGIVAAVIASMPATVLADTGSELENAAELEQGRIGDPPNAAELADVQTMAQQHGISMEEAIRSFAWHDDFSRLVESMREAFPNDFAGARITGSSNAWIAFAGPAPQGSRQAAESFADVVNSWATVDVDVIADRGFTEAGIDSAMMKIHHTLLGATGVMDVSSGYDIETGTILSEVETASSVPGVDGLGLARLVQSLVPSGVDLKLRGTDSVSYAPEAHYGGEALSSCTSGFMVKSGSTKGVVTAGHCRNDQWDDGAALTHVAGHVGYWGDVQWHRGPQAVYDDFYAGSGTTLETDLRDVSAVGHASEGQSICKNGKTTKKGCTKVYQLNHCAGDACRLTLTEDYITADGDSGGPWFWGNTAYGVHYGTKYWFGDRSGFTRARYVDDALGAAIATSP